MNKTLYVFKIFHCKIWNWNILVPPCHLQSTPIYCPNPYYYSKIFSHWQCSLDCLLYKLLTVICKCVACFFCSECVVYVQLVKYSTCLVNTGLSRLTIQSVVHDWMNESDTDTEYSYWALNSTEWIQLRLLESRSNSFEPGCVINIL